MSTTVLMSSCEAPGRSWLGQDEPQPGKSWNDADGWHSAREGPVGTALCVLRMLLVLLRELTWCWFQPWSAVTRAEVATGTCWCLSSR